MGSQIGTQAHATDQPATYSTCQQGLAANALHSVARDSTSRLWVERVARGMLRAGLETTTIVRVIGPGRWDLGDSGAATTVSMLFQAHVNPRRVGSRGSGAGFRA